MQEIFRKIQNRRVRGRRAGGAVRRLRLSQTAGAGGRPHRGKGLPDPRSAAASRRKIDLERIKAIAPLEGREVDAARRHHQRRELSQPQRNHGVIQGQEKRRRIAKAVAFARANNLAITAAGVRHSMGGHAFLRGGIVLDMRAFNRIKLNDVSKDRSPSSRAQAGTTSRTSSIRALPCAPCNPPTSLPSAVLSWLRCSRHGSSGRRAGAARSSRCA